MLKWDHMYRFFELFDDYVEDESIRDEPKRESFRRRKRESKIGGMKVTTPCDEYNFIHSVQEIFVCRHLR